MKKIFFLLGSTIASTLLFAQEPSDALRYSWHTQTGTARNQAIGGAMGALGGEITATFVNPAGLGFYRTGDFVFTPGYTIQKNKANYYNRKESDKSSNFLLGTSGFVFGKTDYGKKRKSSAISIAVNRTADFNQQILYRGVNKESSYSQKFLEELKNDNVQTGAAASDYPFGTSLAINTFWIDTANGWSAGNKTFRSLATPLLSGEGLIQENVIEAKGGITELAIGFGANTNDKLYWGVSFGVPFLRYERVQTFTEADATDNPNNNFDYASFRENLSTKGVGINVKLGVIYKPVEKVRLGAALHSPTFYTMTDVFSADMVTDTENFQGVWNQSNYDVSGFANGEFEYQLMTPLKAILSGTYILNEVEDVRQQKGFITADIEYVDYTMNSFSQNTDYYSYDNYLKSLNKAIDKAYKSAVNVRVGGELKFNTIMARLGAAYYGNPYKNLGNGEKGSQFLVTGGLGYRHKGMFVDLAYVHNMTKDVHYGYRLQEAPFTAAKINRTVGQAMLTVGLKF